MFLIVRVMFCVSEFEKNTEGIGLATSSKASPEEKLEGQYCGTFWWNNMLVLYSCPANTSNKTNVYIYRIVRFSCVSIIIHRQEHKITSALSCDQMQLMIDSASTLPNSKKTKNKKQDGLKLEGKNKEEKTQSIRLNALPKQYMYPA